MPSDVLVIDEGDCRKSFSTWGDSWKGFRESVLEALRDPRRRMAPRNREYEWEPVYADLSMTVGLKPRPDNDYNPRAISVVSLDAAGSAKAHMGYLYERDLSAWGGSIHALAALSTLNIVHCTMAVRLEQFSERTRRTRKPSEEHLFTYEECRELGWEPIGALLLLPDWRDLEDVAIETTRGRRSGMLAPLVDLWAKPRREAWEWIATEIGEDVVFDVEIRFEEVGVSIWWGELFLARSASRHWVLTRRALEEFGGKATAQAKLRDGFGVSVYIERRSERPESLSRA